MKIIPLDDRVLIEPMTREEKTSSGIILPDTAEKERPEQGKVVSVGPGKMSPEGKRVPLDIKKGDIVLFTKYGPNEVKIEHKDYLIARQDDILAVIK